MNFYKHHEEGHRHERRPGFLDFLFFNFGNLARSITEPIAIAIKERQENFTRKISAIAMLSIGALFFLFGVALLINTLAGIGAWLGFLVVGIVLLIVGVIRERG